MGKFERIKELTQLIQNEINGIKSGTIILDAKRKQYTHKSIRQVELEKERETLLPPKVKEEVPKLPISQLKFLILLEKEMLKQSNIIFDNGFTSYKDFYLIDDSTNESINFDTEKDARIFLLENELNLDDYDIVPYDIKLKTIVYLRDYK